MPEMVTVKKRVTRLEDLMAQLIRTVDRVDRQLDRTDEQIERTQRNLDLLSAEMHNFKDEMREFKAEMHASRERSEQEMREFKAEMHASRERSKQEMREFKDEMREYKTESRKRWGELSNKLGTMAEDLVAPSIERILRETVGCAKEDVEYVAVRVKRRHPVTKTRQEFDVVAVCGEYMLINETKSTLTPEAIKQFVEQQLPQAREFFPEYSQKKIIGAIASLYVDESLVRYSERLGLIVLGFGEDLMDVLNTPGFTPKVF